MISSNTVTPDVVTFANSTLQTLAARTLPAILDGHRADQNLLEELFSAFESARLSLANGLGPVEQLRSEENFTSGEHKTCRVAEQTDCDELQQCEVDLQSLWETVLSTEHELSHAHHEVEGLFCSADVNGTTTVFRKQAVIDMTSWSARKNITDIAWAGYQAQVPVCVKFHEDLVAKRAECAIKQDTLESTSCNLGYNAAQLAQQLRGDWTRAIFAYTSAVHSVKIQEADRKTEYVTLQTVQCLISQIHERAGGLPCDANDTHPEQTAGDILNCEDMDTNTTHLEIAFNNTPPEPLPPTAFSPCSPEYVAREYLEFNEDTEGCVVAVCSNCSMTIPVVPPAPEPVPIDCD